MEFMQKALGFIFTKECQKQFFTKYNFFHITCLKMTFSKILGLGIIGGSLMVKVPQVIKIYQSKSGEGINLLSVLLDLFNITAMASYSFANGFPFSAWGDTVFLGIQTLAIALLCLHYTGQTLKATEFLVGYLAVVIAVIVGKVPFNFLWACQIFIIPIVLLSKFVQAYTNYKNSSTGQLSAVTCFMLLFGSIARIFTSIQETGDMSIIVTYLCSSSANALIVGQLMYYWNSDKKIKHKKEN